MNPMKTTIDAPSSAPANGPAVKAGLILAVTLLVLSVPSFAAAGLTIEKPWMRLIIKARPAAGYFTLKNDTDKPVALTGATSSACGMMMLHRSVEQNGVEKMLPVKSLTVPAHGAVSFAPGGYHIMCMKPQASMERGKSVPVTLKFADGSSVSAQFPVKGPGGQ
jgi:periplasmic copper chaperone A